MATYGIGQAPQHGTQQALASAPNETAFAWHTIETQQMI